MKVQIDGQYYDVDTAVGEYIHWLERDNRKQELEKRLIVDRIGQFNEALVAQVNALDIEVYNAHHHMNELKKHEE